MSTHPFPNVTPSASAVEFISNTDRFVSPLSGAVQSVARGGERLGLTLNFQNENDADRRALMSFIAKMNGMEHRVSLRDHSYEGPTGNLSVSEMLDVAFNATNWVIPTSSDYGETHDISEGIRAVRGSSSVAAIIGPSNSVDGISAPTVGASYAATVSVSDSRAGPLGGISNSLLAWRDNNWGNSYAVTDYGSVARRMVLAMTCPDATKSYIRPHLDGSTDTLKSTMDYSNLSVARCLLVDNGYNVMTYSEEFDNASWQKVRATIDDNAAVAPDGNTTADELVEDSTASETHYIYKNFTRTSAQGFWTGSIYVKKNTSQRIQIRVQDTSSDYGAATFDADSGTITSAAAAFGTATLVYASIHDAGNGWYRCRVSAKLAASTNVTLLAMLCDGATNTTTFSGDGTSGLYIWGGQLQKGGQLGRYTETTTTATTGTDQTGSQIWVKGLDASTDQQLLQGDQVEINGQLCILQSDLDGDASGVGLLEIRPGIRTAPSDEDAVILYRPHGRFLLANPKQSWSNRPGVFSDMSLNFIEDIT